MDEVLIEPTFGTALAHGQAAAFSWPPGVSFATRPCVSEVPRKGENHAKYTAF